MEVRHQPCPDCGSSDALTVYDDHTYCFSCKTRSTLDDPKWKGSARATESVRKESLDLNKKRSRWSARNISSAVSDHYSVQVKFDGEVVFPYYRKDGSESGSKHRSIDKSFYTSGDFQGATLFGAHTLKKDAVKRDGAVIVTEGEADALAAFQMINRVDPSAERLTKDTMNRRTVSALSIKSGCASAERDFRNNLELLESFQKVYICFDSDQPGAEAALKCAKLLSPGKAYVVTLELKDACDYTAAEKATEFTTHVLESSAYKPSGIVNAADDFDSLWDAQNITSFPYPWEGLNEKTYGIKSRDIVTWCAGTGVGKSSVLRELQHHYLRTTDRKIGIIALEEGLDRTKRGIMAVEANDRLHLNEVFEKYPKEKVRELFDATLGSGRVYLYDHFGSMEIQELLARVRYMVVGLQVDLIFIDHLSILCSGLEIQDERKAIDRTMTLLRQLTEETGCAIHLVTHLRRLSSDKSFESSDAEINLSHLRGSHGISQISDTVIALERNTQSDDPVEANTVTMRVLKCRYTGDTGLAGRLYYDKTSGRLENLALTEDF